MCVDLIVVNYLQHDCSCLIMLPMIVHVPISRFLVLIEFIFCRLKINHDSHEFILEFGTVTNRDDSDKSFLKKSQVPRGLFGVQLFFSAFFLKISEHLKLT